MLTWTVSGTEVETVELTRDCCLGDTKAVTPRITRLDTRGKRLSYIFLKLKKKTMKLGTYICIYKCIPIYLPT